MTITAAGTYTVPKNTGTVFVDPTGLIASLTINLPTDPSDLDEVVIIFGAGAVALGVNLITTATITSSRTNMYVSLLGLIQSGRVMRFQYIQDKNAWFKHY